MYGGPCSPDDSSSFSLPTLPPLLLLNGFLPAPAAEVFGIFCDHDPSPCPEASLVSTCHDIPPSSARKGRKGGSLNSGFCVRQSCLRHSVERAIILDERQRFCGPSPSLLPWGTNKGLRRSSPPSFWTAAKNSGAESCLYSLPL